jgi:hypothetical protein
MDASKTKKEASEIKISFCHICRLHFFLIPLTSGVSIAKVFFTCQYIFLKSFNGSRFQDISQALGPPNGRLDRKRDSGLLEPQSGMHSRALKKNLTRRIQFYTLAFTIQKNYKGPQRGANFFRQLCLLLFLLR